MTPFKLSEELLDQINSDIVAQNNKALQTLVKEYHYADLAEIFEALQIDQAVYLFKLIDSEKSADMLPELDEDVRESILDALSSEEIATEIEELDTDDAVDIIAELPDELRKEVISQISDTEHADDIRELLTYDENSAGGLMAKELVCVNQNWTVTRCAIPVVNEQKQLVGRITIDDIVDLIKDEAEKDYQLAAGISSDVEADDSIFQLTKARLPWLILGLVGGLGSVFILEGFEGFMNHPSHKALFFFTPLIAAMAGNVGVQSSAIIVQGLANDVVKGSLLNRLVKEVGLGLINGGALALLVILFGVATQQPTDVSLTIALSMLCVIIVSALIGTFVPIVLNRRGIDPAIATGPFITTSNDIFGIFLFFYIAKWFLA